MPKTVSVQVKYKCGETACGKLIRGDKWNGHCKADHGYKFARGHDIKKTVVAVKKGAGAWQSVTTTASTSTHTQVS
jgi:uncharacterized C2H2 Zn-finger protein